VNEDLGNAQKNFGIFDIREYLSHELMQGERTAHEVLADLLAALVMVGAIAVNERLEVGDVLAMGGEGGADRELLEYTERASESLQAFIR